MNKKIKTIFLSFILLFSIAFINIDRVQAEDDTASCTCYYMGGGSYTNASGIETATYFWVELYYSKNQATVKHSCYQDMQYNLPNNSSWVISSKNVGCTKKAFDRGNPFDVNSDYISKNSCSKAACDSANIYIKEGNNYKKSIVSGSGTYKLNAVDKEFYDERQKQQEEDEQNSTNTVDDINTENIAYWAKQDKTEEPESGYTNCDLIPKSIIDFLDNLFLIIQIIGILLLIFLTAVEFVKVLTGSEDKGIKDALKHTIHRIIAVIILLVLPVFITWVLNIVNDNRYVKEDGNYAIGTDGNPLCK